MLQLQMFVSQKLSVLFDKLLKDACFVQNEGIAPEVKLVVYNTSAQPILSVTTTSNNQIYCDIVNNGYSLQNKASKIYKQSNADINIYDGKNKQVALSGLQREHLLYAVYELLNLDTEQDLEICRQNTKDLSLLLTEHKSDKCFAIIHKGLQQSIKQLSVREKLKPNTTNFHCNKDIFMIVSDSKGNQNGIKVTEQTLKMIKDYNVLCPEDRRKVIYPKSIRDVNYNNTVAQLYKTLRNKYDCILQAKYMNSRLSSIIQELQEYDTPQFLQQIKDENLIIQPKKIKHYDLYKNGNLYCSIIPVGDINGNYWHFTINKPSGQTILATPSWTLGKDYTNKLDYQILQMFANQCQNCNAMQIMCLNNRIKSK